jgi:hypothetical protein
MSRSDDDIEAQRLANYSDAVMRGQPADPQGIDPLDAAIVRRLAALGAAATPDLEYLVRARNVTRQRPQSAGSAPIPAPAYLDQAALSSGQPRTFGPRAPGAYPSQGAPGYVDPSSSLPAPKRWLTRFSIAASLALIAAAVAAFVLLLTTRDNNQPTATTVPAIGIASPSPSVTASTVPAVVASPSQVSTGATGSYLLFQPISEPSSVGKDTPVFESYKSASVTVHWDGTGIIIVSSCPDRPCDMSVDDQLTIQVTNSEEAEPGMVMSHSDGNHILPHVITDRFRPGDNTVRAQLWDLQGEVRGNFAPIYIVIIR